MPFLHPRGRLTCNPNRVDKMQLNQIGRRVLPVCGIGILMLVAAFLYLRYGPRQTPPGQPPFVRLNPENFHLMIERFNSGDGGLRVLVMLSPT